MLVGCGCDGDEDMAQYALLTCPACERTGVRPRTDNERDENRGFVAYCMPNMPLTAEGVC